MHDLTEEKRHFPCRTKTKELNLMLHPHHTAIFLLFLLQTPARARGVGHWGARVVCVGSVSSHKGSSSHLPPYSSQPDPLSWAQPGPAGPLSHPHKKASCWGGCVVKLGETKAGRSSGSPTARAFDLVPGLAGQTAQTDSTVSTPCLLLLLSLLSATQTPGADGETERREGGGQMNTMKRWTRTTLTPLPLPPFIFWYGSLYSLWTGSCPLLLSPTWPLLSVHSFIPPQPQPGKLLDSVWPSTPLPAIY